MQMTGNFYKLHGFINYVVYSQNAKFAENIKNTRLKTKNNVFFCKFAANRTIWASIWDIRTFRMKYLNEIYESPCKSLKECTLWDYFLVRFKHFIEPTGFAS